MRADFILKKELSAGLKTAKQLVDACDRQGVRRSTVFYWLKKMKENKTIRNVDGKYELVKFEDADQRRTLFLLEKIRDRNQDVRKAAINDFAALCRETRIPNRQQVLALIMDLLRDPPYPELRKAAIKFLRFITVNSKRTKDAKAMKELTKFKELLEELILNKSLDRSLRQEATVVLNLLLNDNEDSTLFQLLKHILDEAGQKPEGENQLFQVVGMNLWQIILKRARFPAAKDNLRRRLYVLLEHENRRVREMSFHLLDELRMKEYGY